VQVILVFIPKQICIAKSTHDTAISAADLTRICWVCHWSHSLLHCVLSCAVYCNRCCVFVCLWVRLTTASAQCLRRLWALFILDRETLLQSALVLGIRQICSLVDCVKTANLPQPNSAVIQVTDAKKVMFPSAFVCLFVCLQDYANNARSISQNSVERWHIGRGRTG